jgi:hypothetical protein
MDVVNLRTLSKKSVLGFGKYASATIQQIIDLQHTNYLRWIYYNFEGISFNDEVLKEIYISDSDKINKPGKNSELHEQITKRLYYNLSFDKRVKMNSHLKKKSKKRSYSLSKQFDYLSSKKYLQSKNHGH